MPLEDGITHTLRFRARDQVGNLTVSGWYTTVVDTVPPALTATQLMTTAEITEPGPVLSGTVSDGLGVSEIVGSLYLPDGTTLFVNAVINGEAWTLAPGPFPMLGDYSLWIEAFDVAGNSTLLGAYDLTVVDEGISGLAVTNSSPTVWGMTTTLTATINSGTNVTYSWQLGDGQTADGITATHIYPASGSYTATVTAANDTNSLNAQTVVIITNNAPVAGSDAYTVTEDITLDVAAPGVLDNDSDADGHPFTAVLDALPVNGTLALSPDGRVVYTPTQDYYGPDSFSYYPTDSDLDGAPVTVTLAVENVNDNPQAFNDFYTVQEDVFWVLLNVMNNDTYLPDPVETLSLAGVGVPDSGGSAVISGTKILYTPAADITGTETISYTISDGQLTDTALVFVTVTNVNDAPELINLTITPEPLLEGQEQQFTATVNDPGLLDLDFEIRWNFDDGTIVTGTLTPTHTYLDDALYDLTITLTDTTGAANEYHIPLNVENVAPAVTITTGGSSAEINQSLTFSGTFTDPGSADSHTILWDFGDGITTTGSLTAEHAFGSAGTFTVTLTVTDDDGGVGSDQVQVVVQSAFLYLPGIFRANSSTAAALEAALLVHTSYAYNPLLTFWHEVLIPNGRKLWENLRQGTVL